MLVSLGEFWLLQLDLRLVGNVCNLKGHLFIRDGVLSKYHTQVHSPERVFKSFFIIENSPVTAPPT